MSDFNIDSYILSCHNCNTGTFRVHIAVKTDNGISERSVTLQCSKCGVNTEFSKKPEILKIEQVKNV